MTNARKWQVPTVVVCFTVAIAVALYTFLSGDPLKPITDIYLIDVETGQGYVHDMRRASIMIPARRPDGSNKYALIRLDKREDGTFYVSPRDLEGLSAIDQGIENKFVDPNTGEIKTIPSGFDRYPLN